MPTEPGWEPGDFLVHFAGVYDLHIMQNLAVSCQAAKTIEEAPRMTMPPEEAASCEAALQQSLAMVNKVF